MRFALRLKNGITACKWDSVIPFEPLWAHYKRVIKSNGAIVLFGSQPFTSALVMSNPKWFKYCWVWEKDAGSNFVSTKYQPMKEHEDICIFGAGKINYYPIYQERIGSRKGKITKTKNNGNKLGVYGSFEKSGDLIVNELRTPRSIQRFNRERGLHPTQKPTALLEYLIKTYTNEGETVLDNCMGSGSTCVACINTNRNFIGIERDAGYFEIARNRINDALMLKDSA